MDVNELYNKTKAEYEEMSNTYNTTIAQIAKLETELYKKAGALQILEQLLKR